MLWKGQGENDIAGLERVECSGLYNYPQLHSKLVTYMRNV